MKRCDDGARAHLDVAVAVEACRLASMVLVEESREACGLDGEDATRGAVCGGARG